MKDLIAGIDLGTSTSAIGYWSEVRGRPSDVRLVQGDLGVNYIRSAVLFDPGNSTWLAGGAAFNARKRPHLAPYYVVSAKRHLGINDTIQLNGSDTVTIGGSPVKLTPQLMLAKILEQLKRKAEELGEGFRLKKVVVAIPMVYMSHEASLTRQAVEMAGLELLDFIQEPTAAALCYVHEGAVVNHLKEGDRLLVFDLGGGTFDLTVFQLAEKSRDVLELDVLGTNGVRRLGGDDVDELLIGHFRGAGLVAPDPMPTVLHTSLAEEVELGVKIPLSNAYEESLPAFFAPTSVGGSFFTEMTRAEFTRLLEESEIARKLLTACEAIRDRHSPITWAMMVGGSSALPICKAILTRVFPEIKFAADVHTQEAVVRGTVYRAAQLAGATTGKQEIRLKNRGILSHDFGVVVGTGESERMHTLISKGTAYPMPAVTRLPFRVADSPLVVECVQGDESAPFTRDGSSHRVFAELNHGEVRIGSKIEITFKANEFGEIEFTSTWEGGKQGPFPLRPTSASS